MTHLHSLLWMRGSPRIDLATGDEKAMEWQQNSDMLLAPECADDFAGYFERYIAEARPLKSETSEEIKSVLAKKPERRNVRIF